MIRLIATDVDGTLMEPGTTVPEGNRAALRAAAGRGVALALATVTAAPTRMMVTGERGVNRILDRFGGAPLRIVRHFRADGSILDASITATGGTKEEGLAVLAAHLGIPMEDVLALGDAESDTGMIRAAGVGVGMAGAPAEVRAAADWVAPPAGECGVAAAVERFVLRSTT